MHIKYTDSMILLLSVIYIYSKDFFFKEKRLKFNRDFEGN